MSNEIQFVVPGEPVGKGRARAVKRGKFIAHYTPEKTVNYESLIAHSAMVAMDGKSLLDGAVSVVLDIRVSIPKSMSKKTQGMCFRWHTRSNQEAGY